MQRSHYLSRFLGISLSICFLFGNSACADGHGDSKRTDRFKEYRSSLASIPLPWEFHTGLEQDLKQISSGYNQEFFKEFKHQSATEPYGLLGEKHSYSILVDLIPGDYSMVPVFTVFDSLGRKVDSLLPYQHSGFDPFYHGIEYLSVNDQFLIEVRDTVRVKKEDVDGNPIDSTLRISTGLSTYSLNQKGQFEKKEVFRKDLDPVSREEQAHRLMTYNIRYDNPNDGENRWDLRKGSLVTKVDSLSPDIIGFQEVLQRQLSFLDSALEGYSYYGLGREDGQSKGEFAPIFYRKRNYQVLDTKTMWLSETPHQVSVGWDAALERIATIMLFKDLNSGDSLLVLNAHFDHRGSEARSQSASLIVNQLEAFYQKGMPIVIMGDFNAEPKSEPIAIFKSAYQDAVSKSTVSEMGTFNAFNSEAEAQKRIDYMFTANLQLQSYQCLDLRRPNGLVVSDHLPIIIEIKLP